MQLFGVDDISDTETSAVNAEMHDKFVNVLTQLQLSNAEIYDKFVNVRTQECDT